jgi:hypothetical protein
VAEKLVAETFPFGGTFDEAGDVDELHGGGDEGFGLNKVGDFGKTLIRHGNDAGVGVDGAEGVVGGLRLGRGEGVEDRRFSDVGEANDSAVQWHCVLFPCYEACFGFVELSLNRIVHWRVTGNAAGPEECGHYFVESVPAIHGLIAMDIAKPDHPVEVSRLTLDAEFEPHWTGWDAKTHRLVVTGSAGRLFLMKLDESTGALTVDTAFHDGNGKPGFDFANREWRMAGRERVNLMAWCSRARCGDRHSRLSGCGGCDLTGAVAL